MKIIGDKKFQITNFNTINQLIYENCQTKFLITQSIYYLDIFQKIIDNIQFQFLNNKKYIQFLSANNIYNLLNDHWKNKKYFNQFKDLSVCFITHKNMFTYLTDIYSFLTNDERQTLQVQIFTDYGLCAKDFDNKSNLAIIFINLDKCNNQHNIIKALIHEFIHYLQWSTRKKLDEFKEYKIDKTSRKVQLFFDYFKRIHLQDKINNIINNIQFEPYVQIIYYELKQLRISKNLEFSREFLNDLFSDILFIIKYRIDTFMIKIKQIFQEYQIPEFIDTNEYLYLIIIFYLHYKVNTFKNNIFGYYFKEFNK